MWHSGQEVFRLTRAQRAAGIVGAAVLLATGLAALSLSRQYPGLLVWGALSLPLGVFEVSFLSGGTTITDPAGISLRRKFRPRCYSWSDITGVDVWVKPVRIGEVKRVRLTLANGRKLRLNAPYHSDMYPNPGFSEQFSVIESYWRQFTVTNDSRAG